MPSSPTERPARPTIAQLRAVSQPESVTGRTNSEHWIGDLFHRHLSLYLTREFLRFGFTPNAVTGVMIVMGWIAAGCLLIPGLIGAFLGLLIGQLQMITDCCDGELARWQQRTSPVGVFLDKIAHYSTEAFIAVALGFRAAGDLSFNGPWPWLGAVLAVMLLLNKAQNDFVHVARAYAGLPRVSEEPGVFRPQGGLIGAARRAARFLPFYKLFHSIELTIAIFLAAVIDTFIGDLTATRWLTVALLVFATLAAFGHCASILASSRLRQSPEDT